MQVRLLNNSRVSKLGLPLKMFLVHIVDKSWLIVGIDNVEPCPGIIGVFVALFVLLNTETGHPKAGVAIVS